MAALRTPLTARVGLDTPVVQAPVGSASCPALAAAVADAGGLGMLAVTWRDEGETREAIRETAGRTDGRFGVNLVADPAARSTPMATHVDTCLDAGADVVSVSFGEAAPHVERCHDAGATVLQTVGSAAEARAAVDAGVDVVVAQGWEAGGHVQSEVATMPLVPRVVDAVPETPVVAAGGVADGRGVAAALTLGADGAWLGTRFLASEEANVHRLYRQRVLEATETESVHATVFDEGWPDVPHRVLENDTVERWREAGEPKTDRPGADDEVATAPDGTPVRRYEDALAVPGAEGDVESLPLYAGQSAGLTDEVQSASAVVETLTAETAEALDRFQ